MSSKYETISGTVDRDFPEYFTPPHSPIELLQQWVSTAAVNGVREPYALALATSAQDGALSTRTVAIMETTAAGLVFSTHTTSRKAHDIAATGRASGLLYWRETAQQVSISGTAKLLPADVADHHWSLRPEALKPVTIASHQSEPLTDDSTLAEDVETLERARHRLPRPTRYRVYLLEPQTIEFWSAAGSRMHRRLRYANRDGDWEVQRLQP